MTCQEMRIKQSLKSLLLNLALAITGLWETGTKALQKDIWRCSLCNTEMFISNFAGA